MTATEALERRIDELCKVVYLADIRIEELEDENERLQKENTKLRLLVRDLYASAYYEYPSYFESKFADRLRQLGIPEEA